MTRKPLGLADLILIVICMVLTVSLIKPAEASQRGSRTYTSAELKYNDEDQSYLAVSPDTSNVVLIYYAKKSKAMVLAMFNMDGLYDSVGDMARIDRFDTNLFLMDDGSAAVSFPCKDWNRIITKDKMAFSTTYRLNGVKHFISWDLSGLKSVKGCGT